MNQVRERARAKAKAARESQHTGGCAQRRRKKSFTLHEADRTENTPAMLQVIYTTNLDVTKYIINNNT